MNIRLYEPHLKQEGFFSFIYSSLLRCRKASLVSDPRPLPRILKPREHMTAWAEFDGHPVFFDMNDHVFLYDLPALDRCDVYFKANLNWEVTAKVLGDAGRMDLKDKIVPIFFFSPHPARDRARRRLNHWRWNGRRRQYDVCHIAGLYANYPKDGERSVFAEGGPAIDPARYHFWIRYHVQQALRAAGISGYYRLTSRNLRAIEDGQVVFPNLRAWAYATRIFDARLTMVNTLPHAVLPWKAAESLALGRPLILERTPLVEMPEPFGLKKDIHFLELLPGFGQFDPRAGLDNPASYRVLNKVDLDALNLAALQLRAVLADEARIAGMTEHARRYADEVLIEPVAADYICDRVRRMVH